MKLLASLLVAFTLSCSRPEPLAVFQTIPDFQLTMQSGTTLDSSRALRGRVWVADFIFVNCTGPCPRMSSQMSQVQNGLAGVGDVRFVSLTVDPDRDTPEALAAYARRHGADPARWFFLTGDKGTLHRLCRESFLLGSVDGGLDHSTRFVLVDRRGRVRRYYDSSEAGTVTRVITDVRRLLQEPA
jgi:protein SCO1/2